MGLSTINKLTKNFMHGKQPKENKVSEQVTQNIVYTSTSNFINYFAHYNVDFEAAKSIIIKVTKEFDFDRSRTHLLLSDLESAQRNQVYKVTPTDLKDIRLKRL